MHLDDSVDDSLVYPKKKRNLIKNFIIYLLILSHTESYDPGEINKLYKHLTALDFFSLVYGRTNYTFITKTALNYMYNKIVLSQRFL